jgi:hypothetical protein
MAAVPRNKIHVDNDPALHKPHEPDLQLWSSAAGRTVLPSCRAVFGGRVDVPRVKISACMLSHSVHMMLGWAQDKESHACTCTVWFPLLLSPMLCVVAVCRDDL